MYISKVETAAASKPTAAIDSHTQVLTHVYEVLAARATAYFDGPVGRYLVSKGIKSVVLAGGALMHGVPADLDLFPMPGEQDVMSASKEWDPFEGREVHVLSKPKFFELIDCLGGKQLAEVMIDGRKLQLCRQQSTTLFELVAGFDFAHCQVGAAVHYTEDGTWKASQVATTPSWMAAMLVQGTFYTGGRWPLRSLSRIPRVAQKLGLTHFEARVLANQVVAAMAGQDQKKILAEDAALNEDLG